MKTLMMMVLLASVTLAGGQTNLTPEEIEARRAEAHERARLMSEYLNQATREALAVAQSNHAARPRPIVTMPPAPRTNNPVAETIEFLNRSGNPDLTNSEMRVVIHPDGGASVMRDKITQEQYDRLKNSPRAWRLTNYTAADIISNAAPAERGLMDMKRAKQMPNEIRIDPVKKEQWLRENFPQRFRDQDPKPAKGSGGGDVWTETYLDYYSVVLYPNRAPMSPQWPVVTPDTNAPADPPLFDPPIFGTNGVILDWSKQPPSLQLWIDGIGTNQEIHWFTNRLEPIELDFHDVGNGYLGIQFPWSGVDQHVSFIGGRVEWEIAYDTGEPQVGTNYLGFEPRAYLTDFIVEVYAPGYPSTSAHLRTIRDYYDLIDVYLVMPYIPLPPDSNPGPTKLPLDRPLPGAAFSTVLLYGSPSLDGFSSNATLQAYGEADATGIAGLSVPITNTMQFWSVVSTNQP